MSVALFCYTALHVPHFVITRSFFLKNYCTVFSILTPFLHKKKVVSDSPGLVDFAIGQLNPVFLVKFMWNLNYRTTVISYQNFF